MKREILTGAGVAIVAAVVLALATGIWNWVSEGGVVRMVQYLTASERNIPAGAIVAFERQKCPDGWARFEEGSGRFIVGVGEDKQGNEYSLNYKEGKPVHQTGGTRTQNISLNHLPKHTHDIQDNGHTHIALTAKHDKNSSESQGYPAKDQHNRFRTTDRSWYNKQYKVDESAIMKGYTGITVGTAGGGKPFEILPPYVALYFCKKR